MRRFETCIIAFAGTESCRARKADSSPGLYYTTSGGFLVGMSSPTLP
jgi:hypothetical protein